MYQVQAHAQIFRAIQNSVFIFMLHNTKYIKRGQDFHKITFHIVTGPVYPISKEKSTVIPSERYPFYFINFSCELFGLKNQKKTC